MENKEMEIKQDALSEEELETVAGGRRGGHSKGRRGGQPRGTTAKLTALQGARNEMDVVYRIGGCCVGCEECMSCCPMDCIAPGEGRCVIDETVCVGCDTCAAICPVGAIEKVYR